MLKRVSSRYRAFTQTIQRRVNLSEWFVVKSLPAFFNAADKKINIFLLKQLYFFYFLASKLGSERGETSEGAYGETDADRANFCRSFDPVDVFTLLFYARR